MLKWLGKNYLYITFFTAGFILACLCSMPGDNSLKLAAGKVTATNIELADQLRNLQNTNNQWASINRQLEAELSTANETISSGTKYSEDASKSLSNGQDAISNSILLTKSIADTIRQLQKGSGK